MKSCESNVAYYCLKCIMEQCLLLHLLLLVYTLYTAHYLLNSKLVFHSLVFQFLPYYSWEEKGQRSEILRVTKSNVLFSSGLGRTWQVRRLSFAGGLLIWERKKSYNMLKRHSHYIVHSLCGHSLNQMQTNLTCNYGVCWINARDASLWLLNHWRNHITKVLVFDNVDDSRWNSFMCFGL